MSFSPIEILEEFADASRLGRRDPIDRANWGYERKKHRRIASKRAQRIARKVDIATSRARRARRAPVVVAVLKPLAVVACPTCGAPCEVREGCRGQRIHLGPVTNCERKVA